MYRAGITFLVLSACSIAQFAFLPPSSFGAGDAIPTLQRGREEGGLGDFEGAWAGGAHNRFESDSQSPSLFPFALSDAQLLTAKDSLIQSPLQPKSRSDPWDPRQSQLGLLPHEFTMELLPLELETLLTRSKECSSEIDEVIEEGEELVSINHSTKLALLRANPFFAEEDTRPEYLAVLAPLMHLVRARNGTEILKRLSPASLLVVENGTLFVDVSPEFFFRLSRGKAFGALTVLYRTHASARVLSQSETFYFKANGRSLRNLLRSSPQLLEYMEEKFAVIALRQMKKKPVVLIPGFASTQLVAWQHKRCMTGDISIGDRVWVNLEKVLNNYITGPACWLNCMLLDTVDQTDPSDCKIRPDIGLSAIYDLSPGVFSEVTTIFKTLAYLLAQRCGYDSSNIIPLPYDWRLAPSKLESRDMFFTKMKLQIEFTVRQNDNPAVVIAHSLGNNIFLYFTKWLQYHFPDTHEEWLLKHVYQYLAIGPPLLGATEPIRALLSGVDFGMPMRQTDARTLAQSFSSSLWMVAIAPQFNPSAKVDRRDAESCDQEILAAPAQWPSPIIHIRSANGSDFGYTVQDIGSGRFFEDLYEFTGDDIWLRILASLKKYYLEDKVWRYFGPSGPERPKVQKVLIQYGINVPTVMGLWYTIKGQSAELNSIEYETSSGKLVEENLRSAYFFRSSRTPGDPSRQRYNRAGDGTVPYASLSWAHTWHLSKVRRKDFAARLNSDFPTFPHTRYSSSTVQNGMVFETVVNEIEGMAHRDAVRNKFAIRLAEREFLSQLKTDLAWAVMQMERMENEGRSIEAAFNATIGGAATENLARSVRSNGRKDSRLKTDNGNTLCFEPNIQFPYPRSNL